MELFHVDVGTEPLERFAAVLEAEAYGRVAAEAAAFAKRMAGRSVWNISSTAVGGGVAEMLQPLVGYARGAGVDARWSVIEGTPAFFRITKRLHNAIHGFAGDGSPLGEAEHRVYEDVMRANAAELLGVLGPRDVVILHDPQTAGLLPHLEGRCAVLIWRCHIGSDEGGPEARQGWAFLERYLDPAQVFVFSRRVFVPPCCQGERAVIIQPSIDPFSAKNEELDPATVRAILVHVGLIEGSPDPHRAVFRRLDGSPGRVDRCAEVLRLGAAPAWERPLVVQVSRWDRLKDPIGVIQGFECLLEDVGAPEASLVLAGPNVRGVTDDPEGAAVLDEVEAAWRQLPQAVRRRVHLASLPTADVEENAVIVNALQRHAAVVVQKSLHEGFGLTVTEAMWKARPVVASAVGGIQDQIVDGENGLLLADPSDREAFADAVGRILSDPALAEQLGKNARQCARRDFLGLRSLADYAGLITSLDT
ncbi:MAG: glycosyltransferase [Myxococcota bacterium]|nr:glycosyltransferase [Myxococcota bacterium]